MFATIPAFMRGSLLYATSCFISSHSVPIRHCEPHSLLLLSTLNRFHHEHVATAVTAVSLPAETEPELDHFVRLALWARHFIQLHSHLSARSSCHNLYK